jgi:membrane-associated phospholipid phosphatase
VLGYVLAFDSSAALTFDAEAARDPLTGQLRAGSPELFVVSVTWYASAASVALLGLALLAQALRRGGPGAALVVATRVFGCFVSAELLKWGLGELAPLSSETEHRASASFPSVHAAVATAMTLGLASTAPARWRSLAIGLAIAYPSGLGSVAVLEGWHYPSDVVAGHLLGAAWALTIAAGGTRRAPRDSRLDAVAAGCAGVAVALLVAMLVDSLLRYVPDRVLAGPFLAGAAAIAVSAGCAALAVFGLARPGAVRLGRR